MGKIQKGLLLGAAAGVIDVIPMLLQNLSWNADASAFLVWVSVGLFIAVADIKINSILKGLLIACLITVPHMIVIGEKEPLTVIPIAVMTVILGSLLGFVNGKLESKNAA